MAACPVAAVQWVLFFVAGHPVAVATLILALVFDIGIDVAAPLAGLVDAAAIGSAAFGRRSMGTVTWWWSHACRFRRRLPLCRRQRHLRQGLCLVAGRLALTPEFESDGAQVWTAHVENSDQLDEAEEWLVWMARRDAKMANIEVERIAHPPTVRLRTRPCGPGAWANRGDPKRVLQPAVHAHPEPDPPDRRRADWEDQPVRLGALSDADAEVDAPGHRHGAARPRHMPLIPEPGRRRDVGPVDAPGSTGSPGVA